MGCQQNRQPVLVCGDDSGAVFVPCVVESVGRLGIELHRFIDKLGIHVGEGGGCKRTFVRHILESVSCALARGNTRMYNVCLFNGCVVLVSEHCDWDVCSPVTGDLIA